MADRPRIVAVAMVRDEADIIGATVGKMVAEVDHVIVADNGSIDATRSILEALSAEWPGCLTIIDDPEPAYMQSAKMTALALRARLEHGAEWIVPFDADEWWYSPFGRIADVLAAVAAQWLVVPAPLFDHVTTDEDDQRDPNPITRIGWRRRQPAPLHKVAARWRADMVIEQGNHAATYTGRATMFDPLLVVRHFPNRSPEQLERKVRNGAAAIAAAGDRLDEASGAHWRAWGAMLEANGPAAIHDLYRTWYHRRDPRRPTIVEGEEMPSLIFDPAP